GYAWWERARIYPTESRWDATHGSAPTSPAPTSPPMWLRAEWWTGPSPCTENSATRRGPGVAADQPCGILSRWPARKRPDLRLLARLSWATVTPLRWAMSPSESP